MPGQVVGRLDKRRRRLGLVQHRQQLQQLQLVVEVVLEPQPDRLVGGERRPQPGVALGEGLAHLGGDEAGLGGDEVGAHRRQRLEAEAGRHRPVVQHVAPRQDVGIRHGLAEQLGGAVAVGHFQHGPP